MTQISRGVSESYGERKAGCPFCEMEEPRVIASNALCYAIRDMFPVTEHHTLIIPKRHVSDFFDLYQPEINAVHSLLGGMKQKVEELDGSVTGFNVGMNSGEAAGQTVFHCHVHLIPRRKGDVENPRGGVRGAFQRSRCTKPDLVKALETVFRLSGSLAHAKKHQNASSSVPHKKSVGAGVHVIDQAIDARKADEYWCPYHRSSAPSSLPPRR